MDGIQGNWYVPGLRNGLGLFDDGCGHRGEGAVLPSGCIGWGETGKLRSGGLNA